MIKLVDLKGESLMLHKTFCLKTSVFSVLLHFLLFSLFGVFFLFFLGRC